MWSRVVRRRTVAAKYVVLDYLCLVDPQSSFFVLGDKDPAARDSRYCATDVSDAAFVLEKEIQVPSLVFNRRSAYLTCGSSTAW
jgi:hypothetical protein